MSTASSSIPEHRRPFRPWRRSGTWMVLIMFAFAFAMIGTMYLYWELHTRPFRPLQIAIGAKYPNSMPRVIGGQHKSHQPGSRVRLRIVIAVDFDPTEGLPRPAGTPTEPGAQDRVTLDDTMVVNDQIRAVYTSLLGLAKQYTDLTPYQDLEIFLEHRRPEKTSRTLFATYTTEDWLAKYPTEQPVLIPAAEAIAAPSSGQ